tara:strand:+ start:1039 stop:1302 length:264 start_codon:yes stop_codon:yes gene_type:complete
MSDIFIDDIENQRPQHHVYDCVTRETTITPYTDEEWEAQKAAKAAFEVEEQARSEAEAQAKIDAAEGRQKLLDLGLTEAQLAALVGL